MTSSRCCSARAFSAGLAAGMAYPTTLALITALWSGPARTRSIALVLSIALVGALILGINFAAVPHGRPAGVAS